MKSEKLREWWEQRKDMSLAEIQLEAITVALDKHKRLPEGATVPNGGPITEKQRLDDIETLERLKHQIKKLGKPISIRANISRELRFEKYP